MKIKEILVDKTDSTLIQFIRYVFVGGAATVVDWGASLLLFYVVFGQRFPTVSNVISFILGLITNFIISTFWVFGESKVKNKLVEFLSFAAIGVVGLLMTIGITKLCKLKLEDVTSLYQIIGKVISTAAAFFWNFFARKILLYSKKSEQ
ncbi:MAG: GtrA family protein [Ruminococcus sp.]|nr:GtrA family protein [Ruminococcus sp.]MBP3797263.1 GtrA family protein [Ruminococcus sp.]